MSQQKIDHRLLNHFLKLKIFDGLGRKQKSLEDVEDLKDDLKAGLERLRDFRG